MVMMILFTKNILPSTLATVVIIWICDEIRAVKNSSAFSSTATIADYIEAYKVVERMCRQKIKADRTGRCGRMNSFIAVA